MTAADRIVRNCGTTLVLSGLTDMQQKPKRGPLGHKQIRGISIARR
jgi:hypothetical protein